MTLRTKTTLIVSSSFLALTALLLATAMIVVLGRFRSLEEEEARRNGERARDALSDQIANLAATTGDWAHWDDAAAFVQGRMPQFVAANLLDDTFLTLRLDVIAFLGPDGRVVYHRWFDRSARATTGPLAGFTKSLAPGSLLVTHPSIGSHREGLLVLPGGILLVASQPVTNSVRSPPGVGVLVFGRILDKAEMGRLSGIVQQDTHLTALDDPSLPSDERTALGRTGAQPPVLVQTRGQNLISSLVMLKDITGRATAALIVDSPRPVFREGLVSIQYLAGSLIACCLMSAALLFVLLSRKVLSPLSELAQDVRRIGASGGTARLAVRGSDELAEVAGSINGMLDALNHSESERTHLEERLSHVHKLEAIGTLSGGVAHDFNNILMVILGFCDLLEESLARGTPDITEVEEIRKAASRAASLTAQLLAFSRRQRLQFRVLDLNGLLSDMAGMLRRLLGDHVSLALTLDAGLSAIKADFGQLQQVVMNLAVNARDAMPGGGTLTIATKNVTVAPAMPSDPLGLKPGAYVVCTVRDTGVGMDETVRARIFEPFYTTKELGRGTGLGLSVVWGIVKQSDGIINVTSAPGQGTTFEIYLPATHEAASATISRAAVTSFPHGNGTVLVAEDDKAIRHLLVVALGKAGYNAIEAADGEDALRLAEEVGGHNIQLLLSDVVMPRMGGAILAQRLREKYPSMRALFISGNADLMAAGTTLPREVTILQKPFDTRRLVQSVRAALET